MTLQNQIKELANTFAVGVLAAIRSANLQDILSETNGAGARAAKRAPGRPAKAGKAAGKAAANGDTLSAITSLLASKPSGLRAEEIRNALQIDKPTVTKALTAGLATKKLKKSGQKRATTYFTR